MSDRCAVLYRRDAKQKTWELVCFAEMDVAFFSADLIQEQERGLLGHPEAETMVVTENNYDRGCLTPVSREAIA